MILDLVLGNSACDKVFWRSRPLDWTARARQTSDEVAMMFKLISKVAINDVAVFQVFT